MTMENKASELEQKLTLQLSLGKLINKIHSSNLDEILIHVKQDIQKLLDGDRVTIYVKDMDKNEIYSKFKDGEDVKEIRVPINSASLAGFVALHKHAIRIADAYDKNELKKSHSDLTFDSTWDFRSGYRTQQVLAVPILHLDKLQGVIQVVNTKSGRAFTPEHENIAKELAQTMGIAFSNQKRLSGRRSKYDLLFMKELITEESLEKAQAKATEESISVEWALMKHFKIPQSLILQSLSFYYKLDAAGYSDDVVIPMGLLDNLDVDYLKHRILVPLKEEDGQIVILIEDPKNVVTRDDIQNRFGGKRMKFVAGIREDIFKFIDYFFKGVKDTEMSADMGKLLTDLDTEMGLPEEEDQKSDVSEDDSGIVKLVNQIIIAAYQQGASDIHVEPYPDTDMMIRFRVDGVCKQHSTIPKRYSRAILSRLKIMSGLDIAERRLPQDGKIKFKNFSTLDIELRVATLPTAANQEDCVMRILAASEPIPLQKMGMLPNNYNRFCEMIQQPYGIALVVGPTGSGKTTTLHSALGFINQPDTKIWTAEDPVEITQKGLRQVQVQPKIGYTFARALKAFLRADPDVIMVGEMRDYETTSAGIEASLTGHLVFSTLHTNNAPETVTRLLDMGIDPFSFGDSLLGVLAQRLIRTLCKKCKTSYKATEQELKILAQEYGNEEAFYNLPEMKKGGVELAKAEGCPVCGQSGYKGRMGIHELLVNNDEIKSLIYGKGKAEEVFHAAVKSGMTTLKQDGIIKTLQGHTDILEVRRVCIK